MPGPEFPLLKEIERASAAALRDCPDEVSHQALSDILALAQFGQRHPGQAVEGAKQRPLDYARLPRDRLRAAIINCLRQAAGRAVPMRDLVGWIWDGDPTGGPAHAEDSVRVTICWLRKQGFPIETRGRRGYSYVANRLEYCDEGEALQQ